jgi:hypothetical protein
MQRTASQTPTLVPSQLAATCTALADRIHASFPGRGFDRHAQWFAEHAERILAQGRSEIRAPAWLRRITDIGGVAAVTLLIVTSLLCVRRVGDIDNLPTYLSSLDAFFTVLAATVAGGFTMRSIRHRVEQNRALRELNKLRSFAHVTDMLQVSKCPTRLLYREQPNTPGLGDDDDVRRVSEYLAYGAELQSITAKVAAVYGDWISDAVVHAAIDDIEHLCADLENKSLQKVLLLEQIHQRIR